MKIRVGSMNPAKVNAVRMAADKIFREYDLESVEVYSGVSSMPMSLEETLAGARNRSVAAHISGTIAVGMEGGVVYYDGDWYICGTACACDGEKISYGGTTLVKLPSIIARQLVGGSKELGIVMDDLIKDTNTKQKGCAIGILSGGLYSRTEAFSSNVIQALIPFSEEWAKFNQTELTW